MHGAKGHQATTRVHLQSSVSGFLVHGMNSTEGCIFKGAVQGHALGAKAHDDIRNATFKTTG